MRKLNINIGVDWIFFVIGIMSLVLGLPGKNMLLIFGSGIFFGLSLGYGLKEESARLLKAFNFNKRTHYKEVK